MDATIHLGLPRFEAIFSLTLNGIAKGRPLLFMHRVDDKSDISRAIRRSRRTRAALLARRRRSAAIAAVLAISLAGAGTWSIGALTGNDMVEAAVRGTKSLADLLAQRSPGTRMEGQLTKTKHAKELGRPRVAAGPRRVKQPVAPKLAMVDVARLLALPPPSLVAPPTVDQPLWPVAEATPPSLGGIVIPPSSGSPPGGSPPMSFPTPQPKVPIVAPPAVPEPGTWATMLLGFALIGWRMRRRPQPRTLPA